MTAPLSPEREAEIRDLEQAAAFGPWQNDGAEIYQAPNGYIEIDRWVGETLDIENDEQSTANAAFVATARTAVPELLAELDRVRAEVDRLRAALKDAADQVAERDDEIGALSARPTRTEVLREAADARVAELAAKPVEDATLTEYGIAILHAGDEVVTNVTTDRDQALRRQAHIRTSYPLARLVSRTVSHGDWTEVTS